MQFFGGDDGKTLFQVEAHLIAEDRFCAGPGAIVLDRAVVADMAHEIVILLHLAQILAL